MAAPSKPGTPTEKTADPGDYEMTIVAPPGKSKPAKRVKHQKTITIPLTQELEVRLRTNAAKVEAAYGFTPTAAQSIAMLVDALVKS